MNKTGAGTVLDGRFEILSTLGNGAMSVVVAARHLQLRQTVAIKLLRPEYASYPDVVTRFLREARAAACLRNEHVVSVTDVGMLATGVPYLVMEHLDGTDLAAHLATQGPVPVDQAVEYIFQVLEALADAHRAGIIHRDIKPANLLLTRREDGSALVKVLDFGVSKLTGPEYTAHGLTMQSPLLGSPAYMSPEQIRNASDVDVRTDIWSVGVVLYELITGTLPFAGRTASDLVASICAPQPTPISGLISRAPIELVGVIGRCVHKSREGRFDSVQELARALVPFVRTASAQVSVDRVLGIASAPRPVARDITAPTTQPPLSGATTVRDAQSFPPPRRSRAGVAFAAVGALGAAFAVWGAVKALERSGAVEPETTRVSVPAPAAAALCSPPEASPAAPDTCGTGPGENVAHSRATPAPAVAAPAVAGMTESRGVLRRSARSTPSRSESPESPASRAAEPSPQPAREAVDWDDLDSYPGARPLDRTNPYSKR